MKHGTVKTLKISFATLRSTEQDISAPPFRRHRLGATVSALTVSALGHLGTGRFEADRFADFNVLPTGNMRQRDVRG